MKNGYTGLKCHAIIMPSRCLMKRAAIKCWMVTDSHWKIKDPSLLPAGMSLILIIIVINVGLHIRIMLPQRYIWALYSQIDRCIRDVNVMMAIYRAKPTNELQSFMCSSLSSAHVRRWSVMAQSKQTLRDRCMPCQVASGNACSPKYAE